MYMGETSVHSAIKAIKLKADKIILQNEKRSGAQGNSKDKGQANAQIRVIHPVFYTAVYAFPDYGADKKKYDIALHFSDAA